MPSFTLKVNGTSYTTGQRIANRCVMKQWARSLDEYDTLSFLQYGQTLPTLWHDGMSVELIEGTTPKFKGQLVVTDVKYGEPGWMVAYQALGLKYLGNLISVRNAVDLTGTIMYNVSPLNQYDYIQANAGLSVGTILQRLFDAHMTQLNARGIAGYVTADFTPLTIVPPNQITFSGPHLFSEVDQFLEQWSGLYCCLIDWHAATSDWRIRVLNTTTFTNTTLTMGTDPISRPDVRRDKTGTYTRCQIIGGPYIDGAYKSLLQGTLTKGWTSTDQTNWNLSYYTRPYNGFDSGTTSSLTSTSVVVTSSNSSTFWATNYWSGIEGFITLINALDSTIAQQETRPITANTSLTAGGTSTISWDPTWPLDNSGYTNYVLYGSPGRLSNVWRLYNVTYSGSGALGATNAHPDYVAQHMVKRFPKPFSWHPTDQLSIQTNTASALIVWSSTGSAPFEEFPVQIEVLPNTYQIRFAQPVVLPFGTLAHLQTGGATTDGIPTDIKVLIPYSRGALTATAPADIAGVPQYDGTGYTVDGIQDTLTLSMDSWIYRGDQASMVALAQMKLDTVKNTVVDGSVTYHGYYTAGVEYGMALSFARSTGPSTGWESLAAPVRSITVEWEGPSNWQTSLGFNNRRRQASGDQLFMHPSFAGVPAWEVAAGFSEIFTVEGTMLQLQDMASGQGGEFRSGEQGSDTGSLGNIAAQQGIAMGPDREAGGAALIEPATTANTDLSGMVGQPMSLKERAEANRQYLGQDAAIKRQMDQTNADVRTDRQATNEGVARDRAEFNRAMQPGKTMRAREAPEDIGTGRRRADREARESRIYDAAMVGPRPDEAPAIQPPPPTREQQTNAKLAARQQAQTRQAESAPMAPTEVAASPSMAPTVTQPALSFPPIDASPSMNVPGQAPSMAELPPEPDELASGD